LLLSGQTFPSFNLTNITESNGLSNNSVNAICQDENGLIWIATENGLNRYDGNRIKTFYKNDKPFNLNYSFILETYFMDNKLWVSGLNHCDVFDLKSEKKTAAIKYKKTCQIGAYSNDTILTGFTNFYKYSAKKGFETFKKAKGLEYYKMFQLDKYFYLGYYGNKIDLINSSDFKVVKSLTMVKGLHVQDILRDDRGQLWFGTWNHGLFKLDVSTMKAISFDIGPENINVTKLFLWKYESKSYIIAAVNQKNGFVIIDMETLRFKTMHDVSTSKIEVPIFVNCIFEDKYKNLWFGTNQGVKLFSNQALFRIHHVPTMQKINPSKSQTHIIGFFGDEVWLVKRYGDGLFILDTNWQVKYHFPRLTDKVKYPTNQCIVDEGFDMVQYQDDIYITTECGLVKMNYRTKASTIYYPKTKGLPTLRNIAMINQFECHIRSKPKSILQYDFKKNVFSKNYALIGDHGQELDVIYLHKSAYSNHSYAIAEDKIFLFDIEKDKYIDISGDLLKEYRMASITEDKKGLLWLSTYTGLLSFDPKLKKISHTFSDQTEMSYVLRSCTDINDNVWFNCQKGYWCWLQDKQKMIKFGYELGLPDNRISGGIAALPNPNKIFAGAEDAVVEFNPDEIAAYVPRSKTTITDVLINDEVKQISQDRDGKKIIILDKDERNVTIYFSVADFSMRENIEYYYKLNDYEWVKAERGMIHFNRLTHGTYDFNVKGIVSINGKSAATDFIRIVISPYWYETLWFKLVSMLLIVCSFFGFYKWRIRKIRMEDELKANYEKKLILLELTNLRSQMNPHFIFNSLNSINGYIIDNDTKLASDYLTKFSRLVRMILENSKSETILLSKEIETLELYLLIEGLRFDNKFSYTIKVDDDVDTLMVHVPPMVIQPFVENAIWHGILPKKSGKVKISIEKTTQQNQLKVTVEDDGIGRDMASELKTKSGSSARSFGINITKQRIESLSRNNQIKISDLFEGDLAIGTRVEIFIDI
jgi:ligand-binding sensor domain-containing protein